MLITFIIYGEGNSDMQATATAVRGIKAGIIDDFRALSAELTKETGRTVSMNSLYAKALEEYVRKPANVERIKR